MTLNANHPITEVNSLLDQAYKSRVQDLRLSLVLGQKALSLSRVCDDHSLIAKSLTHLALFYMIIGEYDRSTKCSEEAIVYYKALDDEKGLADARYNLAGIYYKTDNYHLGMMVLLDCHQTYQKFQDYSSCSKVEKSLGTIYEYFGDVTNAIRSYEMGIESAQKANDLNLESNCYNPLSGMLLKQGRSNEAMVLIQRAIALKEKTGDERGLAFSIYGRGKVHAALGQFQDAEADYLKALSIHLSKHEKLGTGMTYNKLGALYKALGEHEKAKETLITGMTFCEQYNIHLFQSKCCKQLANIYQEEGNFEKSYLFLSKYQQEREAMLNAQTERVIDNYQAITKMKTLELEAKAQKEKAEIIEKKNRAEEAARIKQEFLSTMSHEIRTPLNGVITIANMLSSRADKEEQKLLESLRFSGNNLMRIVNDILDFTKLDSGKMKLESHPVDLISFLENTAGSYSAMASEKGLDLNVFVDEKIHHSYLTDDTRLNQVLGNLLHNAIKFTERGEVELSVKITNSSEETDTLQFAVKDSGIGIAAHHLEEVFESFAQPRSVTTRKHGGTGLGLAIVRRIISLFESDIKVKSIEGLGTTFEFSISLRKAIDDNIPEKKDLSALEGKSVLLAEDNPINAIVANKLLTDWKLLVTHVDNGQRAVEACMKTKFDFILMDIHMPEMNGYQAAEEIHENKGPNCDTVIFALTADISADQHETSQHYFKSFLNKPIEIEKLQTALLDEVNNTKKTI